MDSDVEFNILRPNSTRDGIAMIAAKLAASDHSDRIPKFSLNSPKIYTVDGNRVPINSHYLGYPIIRYQQKVPIGQETRNLLIRGPSGALNSGDNGKGLSPRVELDWHQITSVTVLTGGLPLELGIYVSDGRYPPEGQISIGRALHPCTLPKHGNIFVCWDTSPRGSIMAVPRQEMVPIAALYRRGMVILSIEEELYICDYMFIYEADITPGRADISSSGSIESYDLHVELIIYSCPEKGSAFAICPKDKDGLYRRLLFDSSEVVHIRAEPPNYYQGRIFKGARITNLPHSPLGEDQILYYITDSVEQL